MGKKGKQKKQSQTQISINTKEVGDDAFDNSNDIILEKIKLRVPGKLLLDDTDVKFIHQRKYGLIGANGLGKSTLLKQIYNREFRIPKNLDIYYVEQEMLVNSNESVYHTVINANLHRKQLSDRIAELDILCDNDNVDDSIFDEYGELEAKWEELEYDKHEGVVRKILKGLGFSKIEQDKPLNEFSGGWKMRASIAKALYMNPKVLFLDEPTNHLDLNAIIWLTDYLANQWKNTLVIVSHNKNFINEVCTDIIHLKDLKLKYYDGNYYKFKKQLAIDTKKINDDWDKLMKEVKALKSKSTPRKQVDEFIKKRNLPEPKKEYSVSITFPLVDELPPPHLQIDELSFSYDDKLILDNITEGVDMTSRITIVGANGVGKSTLMKLMAGIIKIPFVDKEYVKLNQRITIGYYGQHSVDSLPTHLNPVQYLQSLDNSVDENYCRMLLGKIGLAGEHHKQLLETLSGGQRARVVLASFNIIKPHLLLLDEPTNHLDIESIEGLIKAINDYNGGVVMVTHDIDLITEIDSELWEIENGKIIKTDFETYSDKVLSSIDNDD